MKKLSYRTDIDGLRALAVLSVIMAHLDVALFSGGFVGVDVFFVISGYLISKIIFIEVKENRFSFQDFYSRRIKRLLPALFVMLAATSLVAPLVLLPHDLESYGKSLIGTTLFSSNFYFWSSGGYFAQLEETRPLLHTWSLAVEEQYYFVFPVIFVFFLKRGVYLRNFVLVSGILASFALSVLGANMGLSGAFYLLPTRFWELLLGVIIALNILPIGHRRWVNEIASLVGLLLIAYAIFTYDDHTPFPGIYAAIPCFGAFLIIAAGKHTTTLVSRLLSHPFLVLTGKISYSLYLWHWPIIVFYRYPGIEELMVNEQIGLIFVSYGLAFLTWKFVETPFRRIKAPLGHVLKPVMGGITVTLLLGGTFTASNFWHSYYSPQTHYYSKILARETHYPLYDRGKCFLDFNQTSQDYPRSRCLNSGGQSKASPDILIWGDSFAAHILPGLRKSTEDHGLSVGQYTAAGCRPIQAGSSRCVGIYQSFPSLVSNDEGPRLLIIAAYWVKTIEKMEEDKFSSLLRQTLLEAKKMNTKIILVGQSPTFSYSVPLLALYNTDPESTKEYRAQATVYKDVNILLRKIAESENIQFFDPTRRSCEGVSCISIIDGEPLYWDSGHMTLTGSVYHYGKLLTFLGNES